MESSSATLKQTEENMQGNLGARLAGSIFGKEGILLFMLVA